MSDLPQGWSVAPLKDFCSRIVDGSHNPPKGRETGVPMLSARNIKGRSIFFDEVRYIGEEEFAEEQKRTQIASGDVLLTIVGTIGRTAVVGPKTPRFALQRSVAVLKPRGVDPRYLAFLLESPAIQNVFEREAKGTAQKGFYLKALGELSVPLAPLNEQKRIADKLDSLLAKVDACRDRLHRVPQILKRFRQSVLAAAVSGDLTADWREQHPGSGEWQTVLLGDVAGDFSYGSAAKSAKTGAVPVLRMGNIQDGRLDWSDLVFTSDKAETAKYALSPGDVLFNRTNSPELVGKSAVFHGERQAIFAGYLIRVTCSSMLLPDYLGYCLNSPAGREYCWRVKTDGVSQSNINAQKLRYFSFELPPVPEQAEIVRRVEQLLASADSISGQHETTVARLALLNNSVLAAGFAGLLVPQDPDDEPVILDRHGLDLAGQAKAPHRSKRRQTVRTRKEEMIMPPTPGNATHYLVEILRERGPLSPNDLWVASKLDIDQFYDLLRDEESRGLLREVRDVYDGRLLEAA